MSAQRIGSRSPMAMSRRHTSPSAPRAARTVSQLALGGAATDVAFDMARGVAYVSVNGAASPVVKVVNLGSGTLGADIAMPYEPGGLDLSTGGDSLLIAEHHTSYVRVV